MAGRFGAVVTAMVTPFRDDHGLDLDAARSLAAHLYERGSDSLVIAGSTGESPTLTHREKLDLFQAVIDVAKGKGKTPATCTIKVGDETKDKLNYYVMGGKGTDVYLAPKWNVDRVMVKLDDIKKGGTSSTGAPPAAPVAAKGPKKK